MIVDSSAVMAVLLDEPEAPLVISALAAADRVRMSAASVLECAIVARAPGQAALDAFIEAAAIDVVAFDSEQLAVARTAYARYGPGSGSPARLNFGDCMAYALATVTGEPLLFKGDDFRHTDVMAAI